MSSGNADSTPEQLGASAEDCTTCGTVAAACLLFSVIILPGAPFGPFACACGTRR